MEVALGAVGVCADVGERVLRSGGADCDGLPARMLPVVSGMITSKISFVVVRAYGTACADGGQRNGPRVLSEPRPSCLFRNAHWDQYV